MSVWAADLLYARDIIPRPSSPPRARSPSSQTREESGSRTAPSSQAGPSNPKVKTEKVLTAQKGKIAGEKRTFEQAASSSGDEDEGAVNRLDEDNDMAALSPEERVVLKRLMVRFLIPAYSSMLYQFSYLLALIISIE